MKTRILLFVILLLTGVLAYGEDVDRAQKAQEMQDKMKVSLQEDRKSVV